MSCAHEHQDHDDGHGNGHHTHPHGEPPQATSPAQSLVRYIDSARVVAHNCATPRSQVPLLFTSDTTTTVTAEDSDGLLLIIPLTVPCRLFSVVLTSATAPPTRVRFYRNTPGLTLGDVDRTKATHDTGEHAAEALAGAAVEHHLPRRRFASTTSVAVLLTGAADIDVVHVELRGVAQAAGGGAPVGVLYEAAAQQSDHKHTHKTHAVDHAHQLY